MYKCTSKTKKILTFFNFYSILLYKGNPRKLNMSKSLVIVESPAKAKTISKILGKSYQVKASIGHVRDLPKSKLGVNVRKNFEPQYEILHDKESIVDDLKAAANLADHVYLAPDPDREGEAIAWHLSEVLSLPTKKMHRVEFNEITKEAVLAAMKNPRLIDKRLVDAQQARRVLDRLVGYKISPLLWRKVNGRSAGRVQSVAVRLICEREEQIDAFTPLEFWQIKAQLLKQKSKKSFLVNLHKYENKKIILGSEKATSSSLLLSNKEQVDEILVNIKDANYFVSAITEKTSQRQPQAPYITSTLQRDAANQLGFPVKKTMGVAQSLYEGIELGEAGPSGLITYMRTDSTRIAQSAQEEALDFIKNKFGKDFLPDKPRIYSKKAKGAQDAHEAIRPTSVNFSPESIRKYLTPDQFKLYKLIWERFVASQMAQAILANKAYEITANKAVFRITNQIVQFAGFMIVYKGSSLNEETEINDDEENAQIDMPDLEKGENLKLNDLIPSQHYTQPPPRFTEASLVKTLEDLGIGRPSTYAATVATIIDRKYVIRQLKALVPTDLGKAVNSLLVEHFGSIVDVHFTAQMEQRLDEIEEDKVDWQGMLKEFYKPFGETLKKAQENISKIVILSDENCPNCGKQMAVRSSRFGQFLGCSGYPECKTTVKLTKEGAPVPPDRPTTEPCSKCNANMVIRYGRYGDYLVCVTENCESQKAIVKSTGVMCMKKDCGGEIVEKKSRRGKIFYGCSNYANNKCDSAYWYPPVKENVLPSGNLCPECKCLLVYKTLKKGPIIACSSKTCKYAEPAPENFTNEAVLV